MIPSREMHAQTMATKHHGRNVCPISSEPCSASCALAYVTNDGQAVCGPYMELAHVSDIMASLASRTRDTFKLLHGMDLDDRLDGIREAAEGAEYHADGMGREAVEAVALLDGIRRAIEVSADRIEEHLEP